MKQKIKIHRMSLSKVFPKKHPKAGQPTGFSRSIMNAFTSQYFQHKIPLENKKFHTCRNNYDAMKRRIEEVKNGKAILVLYDWRGNPYGKGGYKNLYIFGVPKTLGFIGELRKTDKYRDALSMITEDIGIQELRVAPIFPIDSAGNDIKGSAPLYIICTVDGKYVPYGTIAENDGLTPDDFICFFEDATPDKSLAIIQFTNFRY
jgi:hypothetical protein